MDVIETRLAGVMRVKPKRFGDARGWFSETFRVEQALEETVRWYLDNEAWWSPIREGRYTGERLGLAPGKGA